jgi:hypothetical protein
MLASDIAVIDVRREGDFYVATSEHRLLRGLLVHADSVRHVERILPELLPVMLKPRGYECGDIGRQDEKSDDTSHFIASIRPGSGEAKALGAEAYCDHVG